MKSILIVEDDAQTGFALERGLRADGYETVLVNNGVAALAQTLNHFIASVLETAMREKQTVSDASHEQRTPTARPKIQLELAHLSEGNASALSRDLHEAERSVYRHSRLATNPLTLSTLEVGHAPPTTPGSSLVAEFGAASDRAQRLAVDKTITVDFVVDDKDDPLSFQISTTHLAQVIDNLISNALRASPVSGDVRARLKYDQNGLQLSVEDTGLGTPDEFIGMALDRVTRTDAQRGSSGESGLGLSIVSTISSLAQGTVRLENLHHGRFTVTVTIPRSTAGDVHTG
ncbi:hybrid sensor histidine kinase/response regulator [Cryobacterium sp. PH31-L1]|uniref:sensor histidine kinase n=1 Tax=Cryobacterium sp. PH31-L1 TaxID=3046199 RepID=UPI0024B8D763|nr:hybrid sensor histidine kinase/response regulator [Cryobacterium sp. PH31-L1]MDJ0379003.1 hybrid sensor histidine kinase/response regulator [Cryobacterium sp. PH31-L1]